MSDKMLGQPPVREGNPVKPKITLESEICLLVVELQVLSEGVVIFTIPNEISRSRLTVGDVFSIITHDVVVGRKGEEMSS